MKINARKRSDFATTSPRTLLRSVLAVGLASTVLAACGSGDEEANELADGWDEVVAAAEEEGEVRLYTVMLPEISARLEKAFETEYPEIDLQVTDVLSAEIDSTLDGERSTGSAGADLVNHVNYGWIWQAADDGDLNELTGPDITSEEWVDSGALLKDNTLHASYYQAVGIGVNTDVSDATPQGYDDLLQIAADGTRVGVHEPTSPVHADFFAFVDEQAQDGFLEDLGEEGPSVYSTIVPMEQALVSGEIGAAMFVSYIGIERAKATGAPVEFVLPQPAWASANLTYAPGWAKNPNAAQVLANFMATEAGQEAVAFNGVSALEGVEGTIAPLSDVVPVDIERLLEPGWSDEVRADWTDAFRG